MIAPERPTRRSILWRGGVLLVVGIGLAIAGLAGLRAALAAVWGSCHSTECAYLSTSPLVGIAFVVGVYGLLATMAVTQLRHPVWAEPHQTRAGGSSHNPSFGRAQIHGWPTMALLIVLSLATWLRLTRLPITIFKSDEAVTAGLAAAIVSEGRINLTGIVSSALVPQLPGWAYLLAPVPSLTRDPSALATLGAVFSLLTVLLCALVGRRWFGTWVGLTAALLFATGFWPTLCGSRVWNPCLMAPASLLFLDAALLLGVAGQPWALVNAAFWASVLTHLHVLNPVYLLVLPIAALVGRARLSWRHAILAGTVFVAGISPYLLWELTPNVRFNDFRHVLQTGLGGQAQLDLAPVRFLAELASAGGAEHLLAPHQAQFQAEAGHWQTLAWAGGVLTALGMAVCLFWIARRPERRPAAVLLLATVVAPTLPLFRHSLPIFPHYLYGSLPLLSLAAAIAIGHAWRRARPRVYGSLEAAPAKRLVIRAALVAAAGAYMIGSVQVLRAVDIFVSTLASDEYGVPAAYTWRAAQTAGTTWLRVESRQPIFVGGHRSDVQPLLYELGGRRPWTVEAFDDCRGMPKAVAGGPAVVLLWDTDSPAADRLSRSGQRLLSAEHLPRPGSATFGLYVVDGSVLGGESIAFQEATRFTTCLGRSL